jgi:hypothetical protein
VKRNHAWPGTRWRGFDSLLPDQTRSPLCSNNCIVKFCSRCQTSKPFSDFNKSEARGYQAYCRSCQSVYDKTCSSPERIRKRTERAIQNCFDCQSWIRAYLQGHPCVDCGEPDIVVLDFDHLGDKDECVSNLMRRNSSLKRIQAEVAKCEVRCANCHRRMTAKRNGAWWRCIEGIPNGV